MLKDRKLQQPQVLPPWYSGYGVRSLLNVYQTFGGRRVKLILPLSIRPIPLRTVVANPELLQCRAVVELAIHADTTSSPSVGETVTNWYHTSSCSICTGGTICCAKRI